MSKELAGAIGVMLGAMIGFLGSILVAFLERGTEREKRREDRLWHIRQERVKILRPSLEQLYEYLDQSLAWAQDMIGALDGLAASQKLTKQVQKTRRQAHKLNAQVGKTLPQLRKVLSRQDTKLGTTIAERTTPLAKEIHDLVKEIGDFVTAIGRGQASPDDKDIAKLRRLLDSCRSKLIQVGDDIDRAIEDYLAVL